jgi:hypothetical protein
LIILLPFMLLALPAVALAEEEQADLTFSSAQETRLLKVVPGHESSGFVYFYNVDGNRIAHITLETTEAPDGWQVEIAPPLHDIQVSFGGDTITVTENLHAEPTDISLEEIEDVPDGMVCLTLPSRGATEDEPGYCLATKVSVTIRVPESVDVGTSDEVTLLATASFLGQSGMTIGQQREFTFPVTTVYEVTDETIIGNGGGFDAGRWLPVIIAVGIVALAAVLLPRFSARRRAK